MGLAVIVCVARLCLGMTHAGQAKQCDDKRGADHAVSPAPLRRARIVELLG